MMLRQGLFFITLILLLAAASPAWAEGKFASIVVDAATGKVLQATAAGNSRHPASLTKIMTLYLTFKALRQGTLRINQALPVSKYAASMPPSKLGLRAGSQIRVRDAILALVTESANDAAVVLAEAMGGSEGNFAYKMTAQARKLGMKSTVFRNASGLPNDDQITTARDMAILARALYFNFPEHYRFFSTASFTYLGRTHRNHNHLMRRYSGMDGIKTGYIRASGFNLVASAVSNKTRLIAVIFGGNSAKERDRDMAALLDASFARLAKDNKNQAPLAAPSGLIARDMTPDDREAQGDAEADTGARQAEAAVTPASFKLAAASETAVSPAVPQGIALPMPNPTGAAAPAKPVKEKETTKAVSKTISENAPKDKKSKAAAEHWRVQLGAYALRSSAEAALKRARDRLKTPLSQSRGQVVATNQKGKKLFKPLLLELDKISAKTICRSLGAKFHCAVLPPE